MHVASLGHRVSGSPRDASSPERLPGQTVWIIGAEGEIAVPPRLIRGWAAEFEAAEWVDANHLTRFRWDRPASIGGETALKPGDRLYAALENADGPWAVGCVDVARPEGAAGNPQELVLATVADTPCELPAPSGSSQPSATSGDL